jgi:glyoxalase family protein
LRAAGVPVEDPKTRFDDEVLAFADPDGLRLELVAHEGAADLEPWQDGPIPTQRAIRAFHGVTLIEQSLAGTADLLTGRMGFEEVDSQGARHRFVAADGGPASRVDVLVMPNEGFGQIAVGSVHHVAFRIAGDEQQDRWRDEALAGGLQVTGVRDRLYFRSIYFREPGGVLFEVATDPPGFTVDETVADLGSSLKLPGWLEPKRQELERTLPSLTLPVGEPLTS